VTRELVERAAKGDQEAFAGLARLSSNRLFAIAWRILRDHHLAEDAVQQTLITVWNELPRLRDPDRFEAWTYRLVVRAAMAEARRGKRGALVQLLPDDADVSRAPDQFGSVADRDRIERGFRKLTPEQRAVLVLQHYVELGLPEIAELLDVPLGTVKSRSHAARQAMRAALEADDRAIEGAQLA
jgi:RNA polymerase sigma-70 factor (ECF subfamily)